MLDLRNGVGRLRRIVDDTGTELRVRSGLQCRSEAMSAITISCFALLSFRLRLVWQLSQQTALLLCGNNFFLDLCKAVRFWLTRVSAFFLASRAAICSGVSFSPSEV